MTWHVSNRITFRARKTGVKADIEKDADKVAMELCLYAQQKYPDYLFQTQATSIMQPLSEQVR